MPRNATSVETLGKRETQTISGVIHIYGCFAGLPDFPGNPVNILEYGSITGHGKWKGGWERIKLIGEGLPDDDDIRASREWIEAADYVIILGFGFDHTNLNLIGLDKLSEEKFLFCSGFRLNAETRSRVRWSCTPARVHFAREDTDIGTFLENSRLLSSAVSGEPVERAYARLGPGIP